MLDTMRFSQPCRVGLCDSQPVMAEGVCAILRGDPTLAWCWNKFSLEQLRESQAENPADVVLVDRAFGSLAITEWLSEIRSAGERPKVAVWSTVMSVSEAERFVCAGASGILMRSASPSDVLDCLRRLSTGGMWAHPSLFPRGMARVQRRELGLTAREQEVCELVRRGFSNREVAADLGITPGTVKIHLQHIFAKAGVRDRSALARVSAALLPAPAPAEPDPAPPPPLLAAPGDAKFALAKV